MYKHLTREQRYAIYPGKQKKQTNKAIARLIGVSESTVSRELKRNATKNGKYVWDKADALSQERMHRAPGNRSVSRLLLRRVRELITGEQWSPKQISGYPGKEGGEDLPRDHLQDDPQRCGWDTCRQLPP